jgi:hypothetical protein
LPAPEQTISIDRSVIILEGAAGMTQARISLSQQVIPGRMVDYKNRPVECIQVAVIAIDFAGTKAMVDACHD